MRFKLILIVLLCSFVYGNVAEAKIDAKIKGNKKEFSDANIVGHVVDAETNEHLPYSVVSLKGTTIYQSCDATGHYSMENLPEGKYIIQASLLGFTPVKKEIVIRKNTTIEVNFSLKEDQVYLDQVVVSSNRTEVAKKMSPSLVKVLNTDLFESTSAVSLADGLSFQPGVRVEDNCQNCGFTQVRMNGLDGHYTQILMDSHPVFSALTGVYGLEQIPANMIERVEVIRGGGSALYGSSAIGGVVNIITKEPNRNSAGVSHNIMSIGNSDSFDNNTTMNATVVLDNKLGLSVYGQKRDRESYDDDGDGYSEVPVIHSQTIGLSSYFKITDYSKLKVRYHGIKEFRRGGDSLDLPAHQANIAEQVDHRINGGDVSYDLYSGSYNNHFNIFSSFQNTKRESYYGSGQDLNAYGHTKDFVSVSGAQYTHGFDYLFFMPSELLIGTEFKYNELEDVSAGYDHEVEQTVRIYSGFIQNEWKNKKYGILLGARFDKHNLLDDVVFSPRVNLRYNPTENLNLRASFSTGFRAPQAFDEDFHVAVVGGERVVTVLANNLKQEKSQSYSISADYTHHFGSMYANFVLEGFYTNLDDIFSLRELGETDVKGNSVLERYNGSGGVVKGFNLESMLYFSKKLNLQFGFTYQSSEYKHVQQWSDDANVPGEKKMFKTPDAYGYFNFKYNPVKPLTLAVNGTYTGEMLVQHCEGSGTLIDVAVTTPDFYDIGFKASYDFIVEDYATLQLNAGVKNIFNSYQDDFDKGKYRDSGYIYGPSLPCSVFAGINLSF